MTRAGRGALVWGWLPLLALAGCGVAGKIAGAPLAVVTAPIAAVDPGPPPMLYVSVAADANHDSPTAVDLVLVRDSKLLQSLSQMTIGDWSAHRDAYQLDYAQKMNVLSWQWVPGQTVAPIRLHLPGGVQGALVFANYGDAKAKPVAVQPNHGIILTLLATAAAARPAH